MSKKSYRLGLNEPPRLETVTEGTKWMIHLDQQLLCTLNGAVLVRDVPVPRISSDQRSAGGELL